ncbi:MAG: methionyl-tRNA formyltransferase [Ruminococcaceae bacterium]|nr:methionyl-tRNA formyltransferase [Oscillospiraceae bacterium]
MRIVFMGTPDFAVPALRAVVEAGHTVAGVFTQPDKPKGRGLELTPPPVKVCAMEYGLPVYQPESMKDPAVWEQIAEMEPFAIAVVAYGKMLPDAVLNAAPAGCINVHSSLLPKYRGAAPINWAVLCGEKVSGVSTMRLDAGMDTGDILLQAETPIGENETAGELHDRLSEMGAQLLLETLDKAERGELQPRKQDDSLACHAPMLNKQLSTIDWSLSAQQVHDKIRGLQPWPVAHTTLGGKRLRVHRSVIGESSGSCGQCGEVISASPLTVACGEGSVVIVELQAEGGKRMKAEDYMRGHPIEVGTKLV